MKFVINHFKALETDLGGFYFSIQPVFLVNYGLEVANIFTRLLACLRVRQMTKISIGKISIGLIGIGLHFHRVIISLACILRNYARIGQYWLWNSAILLVLGLDSCLCRLLSMDPFMQGQSILNEHTWIYFGLLYTIRDEQVFYALGDKFARLIQFVRAMENSNDILMLQ